MAYTLNPFSGVLDYYEKGTTSSGTITNHGDLTGLSNDDHPQYHNNTRGDVRYYKKDEVNTISDGLQTNIDGKSDTGHTHDTRYYTKDGVNTISGGLQTNIDGKSDTGHTHTEANITDLDHDAVKLRGRGISSTDTPNNGESITWNSAESEWRYTMISGGSGGSSNHSELNELDYASAGHIGFASSASQTTLSGNLQTNIDGKANTIHTHTEDNITDLDKYTQAEVDSLITTISGKLDDHNELNNLDYASSGHTGFQPAGNYLTDTEFSTYSGTLQTQIDEKSDIGHAHDDRYYTEDEVDTISGTLNDKISAETLWDRDGTTITPHNAGDTISGTGSIHSTSEFGDGTNYTLKWNPTNSSIDVIFFGSSTTHQLLSNGNIEITGELIETGGTSSGTGEVYYYTKDEVDTISGSLQTNIDACQTIQLIATPTINHSTTGPQCNDILAGEPITIMDCVYLHNDGKWYKTCATASSTADGMLAISLESKNENQTMNVAMPGCFIRNDNWAWTTGQKIYLATTSGSLTQVTVSGTDEVIKTVGHATNTTKIFFNPDQTVIIHI